MCVGAHEKRSKALSVNPDMSYLHGPAQVDACFNGNIVGGLEESPLQEQGKEEQYGQHISILQKNLGGNEIDPPQSHLKAQKGREREGGLGAQISTSLPLLRKVNHTVQTRWN